MVKCNCYFHPPLVHSTDEYSLFTFTFLFPFAFLFPHCCAVVIYISFFELKIHLLWYLLILFRFLFTIFSSYFFGNFKIIDNTVNRKWSEYHITVMICGGVGLVVCLNFPSSLQFISIFKCVLLVIASIRLVHSHRVRISNYSSPQCNYFNQPLFLHYSYKRKVKQQVIF